MKYLTMRHADTGALEDAWQPADVAPDEFDAPALYDAAVATLADGGPRVVGDYRIAMEDDDEDGEDFDVPDDRDPADGFPPRNFDPFGGP